MWLGMVDVVVSVWGDPSRWKPVEGYCVELPGGGSFTASRTYRCSLGALMEAFSGSRVLLFASSTLGDPSVGRYSSLVDSVCGLVEFYLRGGEYCSDASRVGVVVLPGVGRFERGVVRSFLGGLGQFRVAAFLKALDFFTEFRPERVVLDLTHGLNYMPTYVRLSVFDALTCYSALAKTEVKLLVYNSEPFPEGAEEASGLNIMLVEDYIFKPAWALGRLYDLLASAFTTGFKPTPIRSVFGRRPPSYSEGGWRSLYRCVERLVKAASWGLIIPLAESLEELSSLDLESLKRELERFSYLRDCEDLVEVSERRLRYLFSPVYEAALLLGFAEALRSLDLKVRRVDGGFSGSELRALGDALLQKTPLELFKYEWSQIADRVRLLRHLGFDVGCWRRLKAYTEVGNLRFRGISLLEYMRKAESFDVGKILSELGGEVDRALAEGERVADIEGRNFIAHAGLERNITLVSARGDDIFVKYDEGLRDRVDKVMQGLS
ncbi:MAG: CRISPR-associated DxTHG motif protein [Thaumarchaeota archaeon]|nr:CRISPR-associated DxTHG motif protein [Nitrososphaerota archaeon]